MEARSKLVSYVVSYSLAGCTRLRFLGPLGLFGVWVPYAVI
jgi:hypothetical protein